MIDWIRALTLSGCVLACLFGIAGDAAARIYWLDSDSTQRKLRSGTDSGTGQVDLVTTGNDPRGLAVDRAGGKVYWTESVTRHRIFRADLDGSNVEEIVDRSSTSETPLHVAVDSAGGKIYWTDDANTVKRANLDGSSIETVVLLGAFGSVTGIALDVGGGKIYMTEDSQGGLNQDRIFRMDFDGSNQEALVGADCPSECFQGIDGIALDLSAGKMYWGAEDPATVIDGRVQRANLDGSGYEPNFIVGTASVQIGNPRSLAVSPDRGKLFFTAREEVFSANIDGSGLASLFGGVGESPKGIAHALPALPLWALALLTLAIGSSGGVRARSAG